MFSEDSWRVVPRGIGESSCLMSVGGSSPLPGSRSDTSIHVEYGLSASDAARDSALGDFSP